MKYTCHRKWCLNSHINTQCSPLWQQCRHVFSHTNGHKGAEYHPVIDCSKILTPVFAIWAFEQGCIVGLGSWMDISMDYCTMYQWCVAAVSSGLWNIPTPVDQVLDDCIAQMHVKINTLCKQKWLYSGKKSRHMLYLLCHQGPLELSAYSRTQITCASGQATTYTTTPPSILFWCCERVDWGVKWHSVVFSDESRFCLYMRVMDVHVRCRPGEHRFPECIRPWHTGPISGFMLWWDFQLQLTVRFGVSAG